ncbi:MAG: galactitol-1-phosphate 5-dehydrogenase [Anaerolineae bacterium]
MSKETMQALVLHAVGDLRLERVPRPTPGPGEALVRVVACGVCGSDVPRVFEHGTYSFPLIPGHEFAGVVVDAPESSEVRAGARVAVKPLIPCGTCPFCAIGALAQCRSYDYVGSRRDGAFAEYVAVPAANLVPVPEGVSLEAAALTEPAAVALHAVRQGGVEPGDRVAVLGAGPIGMLVAQWARIWGAGQVFLADIDSSKLALVEELGLGRPVDSRVEDPVSRVRQETGGLGPDLVVEAAGVPATLVQALWLARPLGRVVIMGNPAADVTLPRDAISQILRKELTIRGTWNSHMVALPVDEWTVALEMMAQGRLRIKPLISHRVSLARGVQALNMMRDRSEPYNRVIFINAREEA